MCFFKGQFEQLFHYDLNCFRRDVKIKMTKIEIKKAYD